MYFPTIRCSVQLLRVFPLTVASIRNKGDGHIVHLLYGCFAAWKELVLPRWHYFRRLRKKSGGFDVMLRTGALRFSILVLYFSHVISCLSLLRVYGSGFLLRLTTNGNRNGSTGFKGQHVVSSCVSRILRWPRVVRRVDPPSPDGREGRGRIYEQLLVHSLKRRALSGWVYVLVPLNRSWQVTWQA